MAFPAGWSWKRLVTITPNDAAGEADYPTKVDLTSANMSFAKANSDGSDLRVTADAAGTTLLDFCIEPGTWDADSETARVWVNKEMPASGTAEVYIWYGNASATTASSGADTFTDFDDFAGGASRHNLVGTDTANSSDFVPSQRRIYTAGQDKNTGPGINLFQWFNIDTGDAGFVYPGLDIPVFAAALKFVASTNRLYIFGGRKISDSSRVTAIQYLDIATMTFGTLAGTLPTANSDLEPCYDPTSDNVFLFGGTDGSGNRLDTILSFDPSTETVTTTSAVLPSAVASAGAAYNSGDSLIYVVGGVLDTADNVDTILSYDPANPNTNPVDTGATLEEPNENQHGTFVNGAWYSFGGFRRSTSTYKSLIQKYVPATNTRTTLAATMPRADDDAQSFLDPVDGDIVISAWLHSDQATDNSYVEKVVVHRFDPSTETLAAEPTFRTGPPTGWTDAGTTLTGQHVGSQLLIDDSSVAGYTRVQRTIPTLSSGVWALEVSVQVPNAANHLDMFGGEGGTIINHLRQNTSTDWKLVHGAAVDLSIASIVTGRQVLTSLIDIDNARQYGLLNRGSRTTAQVYRNGNTISTGLTRLTLGSSTAGTDKAAFDWFLIRKSTTGTEPSATVGAEEAVGGDISGTITATSSTSGTLTALGALSGSVDATSTVIGTASALGSLSGSVDSTSSLAGTLSALGSLSGSMDSVATISGTLTDADVGAISGTIAATSSVSGTLSGIGSIAGSIDGVSSMSGTLTALGSLSGSIDASASLSGTMEDAGIGSISGSITASSSASGTLSALSSMSGSIDAVGSMSGTLDDANAATPSSQKIVILQLA